MSTHGDSAGNGFFKISLGNLLTLGGMVIGFVSLIFNSSLTAGKYQEKFNTSEKQLDAIVKSIDNLSEKLEGEQITMVDINADLKVLKDTNDKQNKRFDIDEARVAALESFAKTLDTNQQLINQQIQFLSTQRSLLSQPSHSR